MTILSILSRHASQGKLEGEELKMALSEAVAELNTNFGYVRYWLEQLEKLGVLELQIAKWNRLVGVRLLHAEL